MFDPVVLEWWDLSNSTRGRVPSPRCKFGFAAASDRLYLFGGISLNSGSICFSSAFTNGEAIPVAKFRNLPFSCVVMM